MAEQTNGTDVEERAHAAAGAREPETYAVLAPPATTVDEQPALPAPAARPIARPAAAPVAKPAEKPARQQAEYVGDGGALSDLRMAVARKAGWLRAVGEFVGDLFHYFFVGCASLLGLLIVILIPLAIAAAVVLLLGIPGYLAYRWFVEPAPELGLLQYVTPITVLVTIFWSGYFVTHGWPHIREALGRVFQWFKPGLVWMGRILENISEDEDDEPAKKPM